MRLNHKISSLELDQIWTLRPALLFNFRYGFARQRNFRDPYSLGTDLGALGFSQLYTTQVQAVPGGQAPYLGFASFLLGLPTSGQITYSDPTSQTGESAAKRQSRLLCQRRWNIRLDGLDPVVTLYREFRGVNGAPRSRYRTNANNFGPRFGFAYWATQKTQVSVQKRLSHGLLSTFSYTFRKTSAT